MFTFILERNLSILEMALKKTSEGRSYQTLRHLKTCADPSRIPLVIVAASMTQFDATGDTWADDGWTEPRYLTSISRHSSSCRRKGWTSKDCSCCWRRTWNRTDRFEVKNKTYLFVKCTILLALIIQVRGEIGLKGVILWREKFF